MFLVLSFEDSTVRESYKQYFLPSLEVKDYNVRINGRDLFDQSVKNDLRTYDNILKITIGQGDDYTTVCLLDYTYFKKYHKLIAIDLSKQPKLNADPKPVQQINFTGNLKRASNTKMFFITEKMKKAVLDSSKGTVKLLFFFFFLL